MRCAIFWNNEISRVFCDVIHKVYNPIQKDRGAEMFEVQAFLAGEALTDDGLKTLTLQDFCERYHRMELQSLLIPIENYMGHNRLTSILIQNGISLENVYILPRAAEEILQPENLPKLITPYYSAKYLPYLEFHAADHCNLNCKACEHYSGLIREEVYPDLEKLRADLGKLYHFFDDIATIRILGGEPLLNPEINEIIKMTRKQYPLTMLHLVTNGLKLFSMPESFFETIRECNTLLDISYYPPLEAKREDLEGFLQDKQVVYTFGTIIRTFTKKQTLTPHENGEAVFYDCEQAHCHNLYDGKIAACFLRFTTKYFNRYFGMRLPEDGAIDLYEKGMTTEMIKRALNKPFQRCSYCTPPRPVEWDVVNNPSVISDWV